MEKKIEYRDFSLILGEETVAGRGASYETLGWGPWQFPSLEATDRGHVLCTWSLGQDTVEGYEDSHGGDAPRGAVSEDGGRTWRARTRADRAVGIPLPNGREYLPPAAKNAYPADWLHKYRPIWRVPDGKLQDGKLAVYAAEDIPEYAWSCEAGEYDPATGKTEPFRMDVHWPHPSILVYRGETGERVYPLESLMGIMGHTVPDAAGGLLLATYHFGRSAATGEMAVPGKYNVYVFRSADGGRTWDWLSEVLTAPDCCPADRPFDGFCEPCPARMPDGSWVMLLRMGSGCPSWLVRSTDGCRTWSKPVVFDRCGVFPQLQVLGCGVSLAGYGRPGVFLRAGSDPGGLVWEDPVDLGVKDSCCYTAILPLDDTTALFAYSDFRRPAPDGSLHKTILVRRVTVLPKNRH